MKYNYIIIEDEKGAFNNLKTALKEHVDYKFSGHATNIIDGERLILKEKPSLIFLDVELGGENGFDLIRNLRVSCSCLPTIIMTTAHNQYGKDSLNNGAVYFLDKPIDLLELQKGLSIFENKQADKYLSEKIGIKADGQILFFDKDEISYITPNKKGGVYMYPPYRKQVIEANKSLKDILALLPKNFIQIKREIIINSEYVRSLKGNKITIGQQIEDEKEFFIGDSYLKKVKELLKV